MHRFRIDREQKKNKSTRKLKTGQAQNKIVIFEQAQNRWFCRERFVGFRFYTPTKQTVVILRLPIF